MHILRDRAIFVYSQQLEKIENVYPGIALPPGDSGLPRGRLCHL